MQKKTQPKKTYTTPHPPSPAETLTYAQKGVKNLKTAD